MSNNKCKVAFTIHKWIIPFRAPLFTEEKKHQSGSDDDATESTAMKKKVKINDLFRFLSTFSA